MNKNSIIKMESNFVNISNPIGDFVLRNATGRAGGDGRYYHYSEVCSLLKKYKDFLKENKCKECGGFCTPSKALDNKVVFHVDFLSASDNDGVTRSKNGSPALVDCLKCEDCGHSFVPKTA